MFNLVTCLITKIIISHTNNWWTLSMSSLGKAVVDKSLVADINTKLGFVLISKHYISVNLKSSNSQSDSMLKNLPNLHHQLPVVILNGKLYWYQNYIGVSLRSSISQNKLIENKIIYEKIVLKMKKLTTVSPLTEVASLGFRKGNQPFFSTIKEVGTWGFMWFNLYFKHVILKRKNAISEKPTEKTKAIYVYLQV